MKMTYSWLKEHINFNLNHKVLAEYLTSLGLEVDSVHSKNKNLSKMIVCEIKSVSKHPNADLLKICEVSSGLKNFTVVCGAENAVKGLRTIFAPNGTYIPGKDFTLEKKNIRGVEGDGMLCSEDELGLSFNSNGIIELTKTYKLGSSLAQNLDDDYIFEISLTPNRGDCASIRGIARDLGAKIQEKLIKRNRLAEDGNYKCKTLWDLNKLKFNNDCPFIIGRHFNINQNNESPEWLKLKLLDIGLSPISALVDITNYILFDIGRPLHVFDEKKITGNLSVRRARNNEEFIGLDKKKYSLCEEDIVISDEKKVVSLAGIMGGLNSCVSKETKDVFLEVAYFDPNVIAKTARRYNIKTDASYRFERGIDKEGLLEGIELATNLIQNICGGTYSKITKSENKIPASRVITYFYNKYEGIMGYHLNNNTQLKILKLLGFIVNELDENKCEIVHPSWRHDIFSQNDIVEEIARVHGYEKIPYKKIVQENKFTNKISRLNNLRITLREALANSGLYEVITYTFMSDKKLYPKQNMKEELYIANPISKDLNIMRNSLFPNLLDINAKNFSKGTDTSKLFEIGYIFEGIKEQEQKLQLAIVLSGYKEKKSWQNDQKQFDFYDIKSKLMYLFKLKNTHDKIELKRSNEIWYHPGKSADIFLNKTKIGSLGEIHPQKAKDFDIKQKTVMGFICLTSLSSLEIQTSKIEELKLSPFLTLKKDFAFLLPTKFNVGDLIDVVKSVDPVIGDVTVFDIYEDPKFDSRGLSIGIEVEIKQNEKVLNAKEINEYMTKIIEDVKSKLGANLRN